MSGGFRINAFAYCKRSSRSDRSRRNKACCPWAAGHSWNEGLHNSTSGFTGVLLLMFSCAVQEGVLVMGQVVGVFICFSYWQQPSPRCLPSWHPIAQATQQRSWPSEGRSDSARSHRRYASPLIDLKRANSSASQAECRGFDPLHPLICLPA